MTRELGASATKIIQSRRTDTRRLSGQIRGDLDWIVMRALEKDRNRRYASPAELAQDIQRDLDDQPRLAVYMNDAAQYRNESGDYEGALADFDRALQPYEQHFGTEHPDVLAVLRNEGLALRALERSDEGLVLFDQALEIAGRMYEPDDPRTALAHGDRGVTLMALGRYDEARAALLRAFDVFLEKSGVDRQPRRPRPTSCRHRLRAARRRVGRGA
ncbi:MAG TPA: tetratricopeptide repeat protein [Candidatus Krumholzibacteria bacterium]|nr:tetratricopeptide repeat protein [Candidatus Krumholzibacteria bacterium]